MCRAGLTGFEEAEPFSKWSTVWSRNSTEKWRRRLGGRLEARGKPDQRGLTECCPEEVDADDGISGGPQQDPMSRKGSGRHKSDRSPTPNCRWTTRRHRTVT